MPTFTIPEPVEFDGEWWLPERDAEEHHVAGRLSWSTSRAKLELHDAFTSIARSASFGDGCRYESVHGTSTKGHLISVLDALSLGGDSSIGSAGFREAENLVSSWVIIGAHVNRETKYSELSLRMPGLQIWLGGRGAQHCVVHKTDDYPLKTVYCFEGVEEEKITVPAIGLTVGFSIARSFSGSVDSEVVVRTSVYLRLVAAESQRLEWLLEQFGRISTLLAFISGSPMGADQMSAKLSDGNAVEVLVAMREAKCCEYKAAGDFFMRRNQMQCELAAVVVRWFELYDSIAMPSRLALSVLYSKDLWLHVEFLSTMQALEGFHRATMDGVYVTKEQYLEVEEKMLRAIPNGTPSDLRSSLKARLKYGNEISLRKRMDELASRLNPDFGLCFWP